MKYDHTIVHDGKECNAVEIIRKLNLNQTVYYNQRKKGMSAQDAFLYCLHLKNKIPIAQFAKEKEISQKAIGRGFQKGLSLEEIEEALRKKKEKEFESLEYLRKIGLPLEYNSLTDFCNREQLNRIKIYKRIQKGMNLYNAVKNSLIIKDGYIKRASKYFGVQLKSIAQKYKLDPNQINFWLRKGYSYQETIEKEVFARTFSAFGNDVRKFQYLWKIYQNEFLKGIDIQDKVTDRELESFVVSYNRMEHITRDLTYYEFLEGVGISYYKLLSLDERVQDVLLTDSNVSFTLSELYYILDFEYGLMSEFTYIEKYHVWIYSGNREVLKKLKKPSD